MVKLTIISNDYINIQNKLEGSNLDNKFELIIKTDNPESFSNIDSKIKTVSAEKTIDEVLNYADGDYILFNNNYEVLENPKLEEVLTLISSKSAEVIIFNQNDDNNVISRFVGLNTFNYKKINEYVFHMDYSINNFIFSKQFLIDNNIYDENIIQYISVLKSNKLIFSEDNINTFYINKYDYEHLEDFLNTLNKLYGLVEKEEDSELTSKLNNYIIEKAVDEYDKTELVDKKNAFNLLRTTFINILNSEKLSSDDLTDVNRKAFEQVIISDSVEEYDLLKKVSKDKLYVNYMKRYEKILQTEHKKIKNFNESLTSSNSWKLTKFLRIRNKN